jgi:hypothetical protein
MRRVISILLFLAVNCIAPAQDMSKVEIEPFGGLLVNFGLNGQGGIKGAGPIVGLAGGYELFEGWVLGAKFGGALMATALNTHIQFLYSIVGKYRLNASSAISLDFGLLPAIGYQWDHNHVSLGFFPLTESNAQVGSISVIYGYCIPLKGIVEVFKK